MSIETGEGSEDQEFSSNEASTVNNTEVERQRIEMTVSEIKKIIREVDDSKDEVAEISIVLYKDPNIQTPKGLEIRKSLLELPNNLRNLSARERTEVAKSFTEEGNPQGSVAYGQLHYYSELTANPNLYRVIGVVGESVKPSSDHAIYEAYHYYKRSPSLETNEDIDEE